MPVPIGTLYIIATPIGNLEDITLRALRILKEVDLIACEDTRTTGKLLARYGIEKPLASYHEHNEEKKAAEIVSAMEAGRSVAVVSDAGTPTISDPGYRIVSLAASRGIEVVPIPGASAAIAALSVSGLSTSRFAFFGFPPKTAKKLGEFLESARDYTGSLIIYESPGRVVNTLEAALAVLGDRQISASREITKLYEETLRGKISEVGRILRERPSIKGEFTIVIEGKSGAEEASDESIGAEIGRLKAQGLTLKDTVKAVCETLRSPKSKTYREALRIWRDGGDPI
ncbi:MAG: 16S rRNA (cytidine(1402)-2'-O)-methyltransferase [Deltaproteobacteria bacterium]